MGCFAACTILAACATIVLGQPVTYSSPQILLQGRFSPGADSAGVAKLPQLVSYVPSLAMLDEVHLLAADSSRDEADAASGCNSEYVNVWFPT